MSRGIADLRRHSGRLLEGRRPDGTVVRAPPLVNDRPSEASSCLAEPWMPPPGAVDAQALRLGLVADNQALPARCGLMRVPLAVHGRSEDARPLYLAPRPK